MPIRLIDPNHTKVVDISGTKFYIRSLTAAEKMKLGMLWRSTVPTTGVMDIDRSVIQTDFVQNMVARYGDIARTIAPAIIKIEEFEKTSVIDVLLNMAEVSEFMALFNAIMEFSILSESESKNLPSSSATSPVKPTRGKS